MRVIAAIFASVFLLTSVGACTSNKIIRSTIAKTDPNVCNFKYQPDLAGFTKSGAVDCTKFSIEDHQDYTLAFVEFDDQGWMYDRAQMDLLMAELEAQSAGDNDLSIFVYVHGWKHNAEFCDNNVCCFRETLNQMQVLEDKYASTYSWKPRKVFGIYVGWRGLSVTGPDFIRSTSFYSRKNVATRVALGSTRELLGKIKDFYERKNTVSGDSAERKSTKQLPMQSTENKPLGRAGTRLLTMGHSFGGLVVYNAVAQALMESAIEPKEFEKSQWVKPFGDLVFIVNPAFEGTRYEPLHQIAKRREYPSYQPPVFIAVTSESDNATGKAFPIGRWLNGIWENYSDGKEGKNVSHTKPEQREANVKTIGHAKRYRTHELFYKSSADAKKRGAEPLQDPGKCGCPYSNGIQKMLNSANMRLELEDWQKNLTNSNDWRAIQEGENIQANRIKGWTRNYADGLVLKHDPTDPQNSPDNPFWVVHTREEIIPDHNGFYTPLFLNFIRHTYDDSLHLWNRIKLLPPSMQK